MVKLGDKNGIIYSKKNIGSVYPEKAIDAAPSMDRIEAFITPSVLRSRHLFGIPMYSPLTKEKMTDDMLEDYITRAANEFELDSKVDIFPTVRRYKLPFDAPSYENFIFLEIPARPIQEVIELTIRSSSYSAYGQQYQSQLAWSGDTPPPPNPNVDPDDEKYPRGNIIYTVPNDWIEMANATRGILNVNPLNPAVSNTGMAGFVAGQGNLPMSLLGNLRYIPAYWVAEVLVGIGSKDGNVPVVINEAVGLKATMKVLDSLIPSWRLSSQSLSIDGLSQSVNDNLFNLLLQKREKAEQDYKDLIARFKTLTSQKIFSTNV